MPPKTSSSAVPATCQDCNVRHAGICAVLSVSELQLLAQSARHTQHGAGDPLLFENSAITSYANVVDGVVKLTRVMRDGKQQLVGLQFAPDLLGRLFGDENLLNVEAASDVDLCRVPRAVLEELVAQSAPLKQRLLDQSLQDLDEARDWMVTLGRKDAQQRVASLLLLIAKRSGVGAAGSFELPLSRSDMADFLGLTIETVSRQISKLRHEGVIEVSNHRQVTVPDMARLAGRAG